MKKENTEVFRKIVYFIMMHLNIISMRSQIL